MRKSTRSLIALAAAVSFTAAACGSDDAPVDDTVVDVVDDTIADETDVDVVDDTVVDDTDVMVDDEVMEDETITSEG